MARDILTNKTKNVQNDKGRSTDNIIQDKDRSVDIQTQLHKSLL